MAFRVDHAKRPGVLHKHAQCDLLLCFNTAARLFAACSCTCPCSNTVDVDAQAYVRHNLATDPRANRLTASCIFNRQSSYDFGAPLRSPACWVCIVLLL